MYYQNVRGLRTKTHNFYCNLANSNYDIIILTETWLKDNISNSELFDGRYIVYRRDRSVSRFQRKSDGGGVLIAVSNRFGSCRMYNWESECEDLWVTVTIPNTKPLVTLTLCAVYLSPPVQRPALEHFVGNCHSVLEENNSRNVCLIGDFNQGNIRWNSSGMEPTPQLSNLNQYFVDFTSVSNLNQFNKVLNSKDRLLDLVLTDLATCSVEEAVDILSTVDPLHPPISIVIPTHIEPHLRSNLIQKRNFYKANYTDINEYLSQIDWDDLLSVEADVNKMTDTFYEVIGETIAKYIPMQRPRHNKFPPWFSSDLIRRLREKENVLAKACYRTYLSNHGFLGGRSTCTNLVSFTEDLAESMDANKEIDVVYTDFSKGFDRVPHNTLVAKLSSCGFFGSMLDWLRSYLEERKFYVVVNGFASSTHDVTTGVPQGSHLGPVLFNIFVNDLPYRFRFSSPYLFADDLKLSKTIESMDDAVLLQKDIDSLSKWCDMNGMELNVKKCSFIKFTIKTNVLPTKYSVNGINLEEVQVIRDLGVLMDSKLTFVPHIDHTIKKASRAMGFLMRNAREFKHNSTKNLLYNSLVRSTLEYARSKRNLPGISRALWVDPRDRSHTMKDWLFLKWKN
ncbi:hypothetical protein ABMA28_003076 [Loxostege sticticalis]|uniref:Reverse transcriptase domain-containing protein n=1 Tax=Loxostege sticticalis TaxID=481309 RepID=A0ABD0SV52_LOXSC